MAISSLPLLIARGGYLLFLLIAIAFVLSQMRKWPRPSYLALFGLFLMFINSLISMFLPLLFSRSNVASNMVNWLALTSLFTAVLGGFSIALILMAVFSDRYLPKEDSATSIPSGIERSRANSDNPYQV